MKTIFPEATRKFILVFGLFFLTLIAFNFQKLSAANIENVEKETQEILTNDSIIKLVEAGLSEKTIISLIKQSLTKFDLAPQKIIKLKQAGVSDKIIETMLGTAESTSIQEGLPKEKEISQTSLVEADTTKLSEQQVLETLEALDKVIGKKDLNEYGKYFTDDFVGKKLDKGSQGYEIITLNKEQYLSRLRNTWEKSDLKEITVQGMKCKIVDRKNKRIDRKIELLPDGKTAKVITIDFTSTKYKISAINFKKEVKRETTTTVFFVLVNGQLMISKSQNKWKNI
jgi:hypothetical protein